MNRRARRILYLQYTTPALYPPLQHSSRILADAGWQVLFLGTGALGADTLRIPEHSRIRVLQLQFCPGGWRQKLHYLRFALWALTWALYWRPSYLYVSDPLACPAALLPSLLLPGATLYHEHDSPPPGSARGVFQRVCRAARRLVARRARLCILPNERRLAHFLEQMGPPVRGVCVWNTPSREEVGPPRLPRDRSTLTLLYHGSIGPNLLPLTVLEALALLPPRVRLRVVGYETIGTRGYVAELRARACQLGVAERLELLGPRSRDELLRVARTCDVGLALIRGDSEELNLQALVGASNKAFDYLACGLPFIVHTSRDWEDFFVRPGFAIVCDRDDPRDIARAVGWYLEHPDQMRQMGELGRRRIADEWNYERAFQPVMKAISSDARGRTPGLPPVADTDSGLHRSGESADARFFLGRRARVCRRPFGLPSRHTVL
jgi:glycosyltransferase involved in cell wall biosynthesis